MSNKYKNIWDTSTINLKDFDIQVILSGEGLLHTPEGNFNLHEGDCFVLKPYTHYVRRHSKSNPITVIFIHFNYLDNEGKIIIPKKGVPKLYRNIKDMSFFSTLLKRVLDSYNNKMHNQKEINCWLKALLYEIQRYDDINENLNINKKLYEYINKLCDRILKEPSRDWKIETMAKELGYTNDHFIRIFKQCKGITPIKYIINKRIENAQYYLEVSNYTIKEIADILGYKDVYYFSKQFKKKTGCSPSEYRNSILSM